MTLNAKVLASFIGVALLSSCVSHKFSEENYVEDTRIAQKIPLISSPLEDALLSANTSDESDILDYKIKINDIKNEFVSSSDMTYDMNSREKARLLASWITNRVGDQYTGSLSLASKPEENDVFYVTDAIDSFFDNEQMFDCVAINALYSILGKEIGLSVHTYALGTHVLSGVEFNDGTYFIDPAYGIFGSSVKNIAISQDSDLEKISIVAETYKTKALFDCADSNVEQAIRHIDTLSTLELISMGDHTFDTTLGLCYAVVTYDQLEQGLESEAKNNAAQASEYFSRAIKVNPNSVTAKLQLEKLQYHFQ